MKLALTCSSTAAYNIRKPTCCSYHEKPFKSAKISNVSEKTEKFCGEFISFLKIA